MSGNAGDLIDIKNDKYSINFIFHKAYIFFKEMQNLY